MRAEHASKRSCIQFSLRALLALLTLAGVWMGLFVRDAARQRRAVAAIEKLGGSVFYSGECGLDGNPLFGRHEPLPVTSAIRNFLCAHFGVDYLDSVVYVGLNGRKICDADLAKLAPLDHLQTLDLDYTAVTDNGLRHLERFTHLRRLYVSNTSVTKEGIARLRRALPRTSIQDSVDFDELSRMIESTVTSSSVWQGADHGDPKRD